MICPKCNREFSDEFDHCLGCGAPLTQYTSIVEDPITDEEQPMVIDENLPQWLMSIEEKEEARNTVAYLQEMNIPCMCKADEEGIYQLSVPGSMLNDAMQLLEQWEDQTALEEQEQEQEVTTEEAPKKWYEFWK